MVWVGLGWIGNVGSYLLGVTVGPFVCFDLYTPIVYVIYAINAVNNSYLENVHMT